jgi:glyoxylase-like metal-dependent hydrolase (beta-lactamase superfamily II)
MQIQEITKNVFVANSLDKRRSRVNDAPQTANITCIALPNQLIFVDSGVYTQALKNFRKHMEEHFQRKTSHLLLTHIHWDHILSMEVFQDVDIVIAKKGIRGLKNSYRGYLSPEKRKERADEYRKENDSELADDIEKANLFIPNAHFKEEYTITDEGKEIIFKVIGNHTVESAYVLIPSEKIMCTGDNLLTLYPQLNRNSIESIEMYKSWLGLEVDLFIPGHGSPVKIDYIQSLISYYESLISFLKLKIKDGVSLSKILKDNNLPKYFAQGTKDWVFSCKFGDNWLETEIGGWFRYLKKKKK